MSEKIDESELASAKEGLAHAEKIEHEKLKPVAVCDQGHETAIPDDEGDELPACGSCGGATKLKITGA
ncbi:MAG: hypothetical protein INQ03_00310 [Candidatus Heimdallarchaeota archaeon]|nr:hypothetical protein [Candidatus Heimdallarchaeota archaeon]